MAATNPYLVSDLIKKYGWTIMPYLSNLGVALLSEAQILFVDSGATYALDADDTEHGHSFEKPLATIDYAIGLCTADQGDIILVAPGHTETISGAYGIDLDVDDVSIIGLGVRSKRPVISFSATASTFEINADNVTVSNLQFVGTKTDGVTKAIDVKSGSEYVTIENCRFYETANTLELLKCVNLEDEVDYFTLRNCQFENLLGGDNLSCLFVEDDADYILVEGCTFHGDWTDAILDLDVGAINYPVVKDCVMINLDTTAGNAITVDAGTVLVMIGLRVASGDANSYPVSDISASYEVDCYGCEVGKIQVTGLGGATASVWAS